jgi:hypothetical protein
MNVQDFDTPVLDVIISPFDPMDYAGFNDKYIGQYEIRMPQIDAVVLVESYGIIMINDIPSAVPKGKRWYIYHN